jgi:hypothetical protein
VIDAGNAVTAAAAADDDFVHDEICQLMEIQIKLN